MHAAAQELHDDAEARLSLFGVVQAAGPIDDQISIAVVQLDRAPDRAASIGLQHPQPISSLGRAQA